MGRIRRSGAYLGQAAWCFYDWANSAFPTIILTFVFSAYFVQEVAVDPVRGTVQWGYTQSLAGVILAVTAPFLGAFADSGGRLKPWIGGFTALCCIACCALWMVEPHPSYILLAMILVVVANFSFEAGHIFYNALLPGLAGRQKIGRLSGWAWGCGYMGGLACLALVLFGFVGQTPWFGFDSSLGEGVRATGPLVALWFGLFSLPLFLLTPDHRATGSIATGMGQLVATLRECIGQKVLLRFLVAHMLYADGLVTLVAFGGIFATAVYGFSIEEVVVFGIAISMTSGVGAILFAWADDIWGPRRIIIISLVGLLWFGLLLIIGSGKVWFWACALPLGIFIGPLQASSRSFMAHLSPPGREASGFGLFALSGKVTAFLGPAVLAGLVDLTSSQRVGMASTLVFLLIGGVILYTGTRDGDARACPG